MLKVVARVNGRQTLFLGLYEENVEQLKLARPIPVDLQALVALVPGKPAVQDLVVFYGRDEADCRAQLAPHLPMPQ